MVNGAALIRRKVLHAVCGLEEAIRNGCEDWDFWLRVVEQGYRGAIIAVASIPHRRRSGRRSSQCARARAGRSKLTDVVLRWEKRRDRNLA
jgi:GT2 family glycosyltransferase